MPWLDHRRMSYWIALVVTTIWAASHVVDMASDKYDASPLTHGAMTFVILHFLARGVSASAAERSVRNDPELPDPPPAAATSPEQIAEFDAEATRAAEDGSDD